MAHHAPSFNSAQAADLFPQLVNLAQLSSLHDPTAEDPEARTAKLEVGKQVRSRATLRIIVVVHLELITARRVCCPSLCSSQASHLRSTLATLKAEAQTLPAGNMSLDDQAWLITRLEEQLEGKKCVLRLVVSTRVEELIRARVTLQEGTESAGGTDTGGTEAASDERDVGDGDGLSWRVAALAP